MSKMIIKDLTPLFFLMSIINFTACTAQEHVSTSCVFELPKKLNEVSGITSYSKNTVALIQDEHGIIFIYNLNEEEVVRTINFTEKGDFEDLVYHNNTFYILESNGVIHTIKETKNNVEYHKTKTWLTKKNDAEGLCVNPYNKQELLIACKGDADVFDKPDSDYKAIYAFNLKNEQLAEKPFLLIELKELKKNFNIKSFAPSAIAYHPEQELFVVLSSVGKNGIFITKKGEITQTFDLPKSHFPQPEGIVHYNNKWLITSEKAASSFARITCVSLPISN